MGKPAATDRRRLKSLSHSFTLDLVILVDAYPQQDWLLTAVHTRLREELARLHVTVNETKSRIVDLARGKSFGFLGFEFRRIRSQTGKWRESFPPLMKKRTALGRTLQDIFCHSQSPPIDRVIALINPILRGWEQYFALGDASRCCGFLKDWVEKKGRLHLMRARKRRGFGWKRWSSMWRYRGLGLFNAYRVQRPQPVWKVLPARCVS